MARPSSKDPLDKYRWGVSIEGFDRMGFSSCETPSISINTQSYAEGGAHLFPKRIVDSVEYKPVTLLRGVTGNTDFHQWAIQYIELVQGKRANPNLADTPPQGYRRTVIIDHLDRAGRIVKSYKLYNAFPKEYKPASDFSADSDDTLSMEKLVLDYESFEVVSNGESNNPFDSKDVVKRVFNRLF